MRVAHVSGRLLPMLAVSPARGARGFWARQRSHLSSMTKNQAGGSTEESEIREGAGLSQEANQDTGGCKISASLIPNRAVMVRSWNASSHVTSTRTSRCALCMVGSEPRREDEE